MSIIKFILSMITTYIYETVNHIADVINWHYCNWRCRERFKKFDELDKKLMDGVITVEEYFEECRVIRNE